MEYTNIKLEKENSVAAVREGRRPKVQLCSRAQGIRQDIYPMLS